MTIQDYINKLDAKIAKINNGEWLRLASFDAHDAMSQRIFVDNENVSGQTFQYSPKTKAIKQKKGHQSNRVSFKDTNELQLDFNNSSSGSVKPTKENNFSYKINLKRDRDVKVADKLDKKYNLVFKIRESEKDVFKKSAEINFKLIMSK